MIKRRILNILLVLAALSTISLVTALPVGAATEEDIQTAIDAGIGWLVGEQSPTGQFAGASGQLADTSFAVMKLLDRAYEMEKDPFQEDTGAPDYYVYHGNVTAGLDYIFLGAGTYNLTGTDIVFSMGSSETYNTAVAMMAIASSRTPDRVVASANPVVNGLTYQQVVQGCVDYFEAAQNPDGAWRYFYTSEPSDNSTTGFACLGLRYAELFGCTVPQAVKSNLSPWLDFIQDDVNGDADDGGSWYTDGWSWVNIYKTGHLLQEFDFVGDGVGVQRVDDAVDYIERHWNDPNDDPGWQNNYLAMYSVMKGLVAQGIETLDVDGPVDWFDEIADHILANQNTDGSWPSDLWGDSLLTTEWALLTLEKIAPPPSIPVGGDAYPVGKFGLMAPWIALAMFAGAGGVYLVRRKARSQA